MGGTFKYNDHILQLYFAYNFHTSETAYYYVVCINLLRKDLFLYINMENTSTPSQKLLLHCSENNSHMSVELKINLFQAIL